MTALIATALLGISGTYFESRTCAIFAGSCHYSGEVMVDGGTALLAWRFDGGTSEGVDLAGLSAAAVVNSSVNLSREGARRSIIYLPVRATDKQREAIWNLVRERVDFGAVAKKAIATIDVQDAKVDVVVSKSIGFHAETSQRKCLVCSMPGELWYEPLSAGVNAHVATVEVQTLTDGTLGETWMRRDEPAAFVGRFVW